MIYNNIFKNNNYHNYNYRSLYDLGLLTSYYSERLFASTNFLRGVSYFVPCSFTRVYKVWTWQIVNARDKEKKRIRRITETGRERRRRIRARFSLPQIFGFCCASRVKARKKKYHILRLDFENLNNYNFKLAHSIVPVLPKVSESDLRRIEKTLKEIEKKGDLNVTLNVTLKGRKHMLKFRDNQLIAIEKLKKNQLDFRVCRRHGFNLIPHYIRHKIKFTRKKRFNKVIYRKGRYGKKEYETLYFYNPLLLVFNLKCLALYILELSSEYGSVLYINSSQYNLPIHYMMRWYARGASHSCIGTVWQGGTLSSMNTRFLLVRSCLALPYQSYFSYASRWNIAFAQIVVLIQILRHFVYKYECYGRIRKEINKLRKIFKMFYYYRYIISYSTLDSIVLLEPIYRRSYKMIREVNNFSTPVIGSCSISSTALWYDYWVPMDAGSPSSCVFLTSFVSNAAIVGHKLRGLSLFLKNAKYNKHC